jgi:hypothetical protein
MSSQLAVMRLRSGRRGKKPVSGAKQATWAISTGPVAQHVGILRDEEQIPCATAIRARLATLPAELESFFEGEGPLRELALAFDATVASIPLVAQATGRIDLVINFAMLAAMVAVAVVVIVWVRRRWLGLDGVGGFDGTDGADWQDALVRYRNLRDEGGLSEEEFRRIRTLVGPRIRSDTPELLGRQRLPTDPIGPAGERN